MIKAIVVSALAAAVLLPPLAQASDFSRLADPAVARMGLISDKRDFERSCAGFGLHEAGAGRTLARRDALALAHAVSKRLASDIGDEETANELVSYAEGYWSDGTRDKGLMAATRKSLLSSCKRFFDAASSGKLDQVLSPASAAPLPLPDIETCLAYAALASGLPDERKGVYDAETFAEIRGLWLSEAGEAARPERERLLANRVKAMVPAPSARELEANLGLGCMPAVAELAKRNPLPPEPTETTEP